MCEAFRRRRDLIVELARQIEGWTVNVPQGAFYLFPRVTGLLGRTTPRGSVIHTSGELAMYLLEEAHVATVDGAAFGMQGYLRLSYATSDDNIRTAMSRIRAAVAALK